jgi:hypothetical protein
LNSPNHQLEDRPMRGRFIRGGLFRFPLRSVTRGAALVTAVVLGAFGVHKIVEALDDEDESRAKRERRD